MPRHWFLLPLCLGLVSCSGPRKEPAQSSGTPFVFQALNLRQQDSQGRLLWRVSSPEARYDLDRRIAQSRQLRGEIFANGVPLYRLQASHGIVLGDGEVLQLEGDVTVQRLGGDPVVIRADRMRWYPQQQRLELDRHALARTPSLELLARQATLWFDRDRLELRGRPELRQQDLRLRVQQLNWSPGTGVLVAEGPAVASSGGAAHNPRTLKAAGLSGNTQTRTLLLAEPVILTAPAQQAWLRAQASSVDLKHNTISSPHAFAGGVAQLAISGDGFRLDLNDQTATILRDCRLHRPDAALQAGRCSWNWTTQQVIASGGVAVQRSSNQQTTRARSLNGKLGAQGQLVFSSPGSRVVSRFRLPKSSPTASPGGPAIRL